MLCLTHMASYFTGTHKFINFCFYLTVLLIYGTLRLPKEFTQESVFRYFVNLYFFIINNNKQ